MTNSQRNFFSPFTSSLLLLFSRKEVFQPHLPVRLPCYDLAPVTGFTLGRSCVDHLTTFFSRKEVFQPHLPVPICKAWPGTGFTLGRSLRLHTSGTPSSHGLTGGVYKARERIHRAVADARLLANPASWSRVADSNPNCEWL